MAALEAARSIKEKGTELKHSLEVVAFTGEEGERWGTLEAVRQLGCLRSPFRRKNLPPWG
ncbi:hypothetical protein MASR2M17_20320 [Aminivibrio sp.]